MECNKFWEINKKIQSFSAFLTSNLPILRKNFPHFTLSILPFSNLFDTEINWISCLFRLPIHIRALILISDFYYFLLLLLLFTYLSCYMYLYVLAAHVNISCGFYGFSTELSPTINFIRLKMLLLSIFRLKLQCEKSLVNYLPTWYSLSFSFTLPPSYTNPCIAHIASSSTSLLHCMHSQWVSERERGVISWTNYLR